MSQGDREKRLAAEQAVQYVADGMRVGLGSGSTAALFVRLLGERVQREKLEIVGVPTSAGTRAIALDAGIPLLEDEAEFALDLAVDGADEATPSGDLIKGGGGALLHERIVASAAARFIVLVDSSKIVDRLGRFPLPVEVFRLGWKNVARRLETLGMSPALRERRGSPGEPQVTSEGNYIVDCRAPSGVIADPAHLAEEIRRIPGVADHGLFLGMAHTIIVGRGEQAELIELSK